MRIMMLMAVFLFSSCSTAIAGNDFCKQLSKAGLTGKHVLINSSDGGERNFTQGQVVSIGPEAMVVDLSDSRVFVNCSYVHSVVLPKEVREDSTNENSVKK